MSRPAVKHLDWSVGCGTFAHLVRPDGTRQLIETLWFSEQESAVVLLDSGDREIVAWKRERPLVQILSAEAACAEAGMPVPGRIKVAGDWRRVDPFHSERHRSAQFRALTALIEHRRLACRYSLLQFAAGEPVGDWRGPCVEDPEQTAGNVAERLAREPGQSLARALRDELLADALCAVKDTHEAEELLERAGWDSVLARPRAGARRLRGGRAHAARRPAASSERRAARTLSRREQVMDAVNREGAELSPLSMAEMRASLYGMCRATGLDFFAGLGGLTSAFFLAGGRILHACNHWSKSWLAHGCNFPQVEHELGDLSVLDPKRLPRGFANILVAAPECRRHSRAHNWRQAVMELSPYDPNRGESERSRATMWCPQRWAAYHRFEHVVIENVVEVTEWNQFGNWVMEWQKLGYNVQAVCLNSAFFFAPQGRDRIAIVATLDGLPLPNLEFRPLSWCWMCEQHVYGIQRYKDAAIRRAGPLGPVGKWGAAQPVPLPLSRM